MKQLYKYDEGCQKKIFYWVFLTCFYLIIESFCIFDIISLIIAITYQNDNRKKVVLYYTLVNILKFYRVHHLYLISHIWYIQILYDLNLQSFYKISIN